MATLLKLLLGALVEAFLKQVPSFVAAWERRQQAKAIEARRQANHRAIDEALARAKRQAADAKTKGPPK